MSDQVVPHVTAASGETQRSGHPFEQEFTGLSIDKALPMFTTNAGTYQEINIQNMNVELVAQMFKNYRSNVLFHLEGNIPNEYYPTLMPIVSCSNRQSARPVTRIPCLA